MHWDLFCRVIDNFGDVGVCWRLAADLASRGRRVRLFIDDSRALDWMAPEGATGVSVLPWASAEDAVEVGNVVIEAFGCDLPAAYLTLMASSAAVATPTTTTTTTTALIESALAAESGVARRRPVWINLEYLSAEADVERSHGLVSPQLAGPGAGLTKWFFYPGFTPRTGGLLREPGLIEARAAFGAHEAAAFLSGLGVAPAIDERIVVVFAYDVARLPALLGRLGGAPTLLLATHGLLDAVSAAIDTLDGCRVVELPLMTQRDFDRLLWCGDLNLVRGEDSFVRAQWAAAPFIWQIYPQTDGVHRVKLHAFLDRFLADAPTGISTSIRKLWMQWNGFESVQGSRRPDLPDLSDLPDPDDWRLLCERWRARLTSTPHQSDLTSQLLEFVAERR